MVSFVPCSQYKSSYAAVVFACCPERDRFDPGRSLCTVQCQCTSMYPRWSKIIRSPLLGVCRSSYDTQITLLLFDHRKCCTFSKDMFWYSPLLCQLHLPILLLHLQFPCSVGGYVRKIHNVQKLALYRYCLYQNSAGKGQKGTTCDTSLESSK